MRARPFTRARFWFLRSLALVLGLRIECADFKRFLSSLSFSVDLGIYSSSKLGVVPVHTASVGGMDFL